jgi:hypothetical protein
MMRATLCFAAVIAGLIVSVNAAGYRLQNETDIHRTLTFAGSGERSLTIRNITGSIRVTGSRNPTVQLDAHRVVYADTNADLARATDEVTLDIVDQRTALEAIVLEPDSPTCGYEGNWRSGRRDRRRYEVRYDFTVSVPDNTRLVLCTINGEEVDVTGTRGDFEVSNVNGRIGLHDVRGAGSAITVNGPIEATLLELPRSDATFKTVNGGVSVTWPAQLSADLRMKTFNGGLFTDFDVTPIAAPPAVADQRGGRFIYKSNNYATVRAGRGGPVITLETLNGSVRVLKAR